MNTEQTLRVQVMTERRGKGRQPTYRVVQQVAQLWQRDRAKLDTFSINIQLYSQKHAQNWIFG